MKFRNSFSPFAAILVVLLALTLSGCPIDPDPDPIGSIEITVQSVAPWVARDKSASRDVRDPVPRAWIQAARVKFEMIRNGAVAESWNWYPDTAISNGSAQVGTSPRWNVYAGAYTSLVVSIYNAIGDPEPVVRGTTGAFSIGEGAVYLPTVTCFPIISTNLTENVFEYTDNMAAWTEKWFRLTTPYWTTRFHIYCEAGDVDMYIFKPDGTFLGNETHTGVRWDVVDLATTPGNTYYVGLYAQGGGGRAGVAYSSTAISPTSSILVR